MSTIHRSASLLRRAFASRCCWPCLLDGPGPASSPPSPLLPAFSRRPAATPALGCALGCGSPSPSAPPPATKHQRRHPRCVRMCRAPHRSPPRPPFSFGPPHCRTAAQVNAVTAKAVISRHSESNSKEFLQKYDEIKATRSRELDPLIYVLGKVVENPRLATMLKSKAGVGRPGEPGARRHAPSDAAAPGVLSKGTISDAELDKLRSELAAATSSARAHGNAARGGAVALPPGVKRGSHAPSVPGWMLQRPLLTPDFPTLERPPITPVRPRPHAPTCCRRRRRRRACAAASEASHHCLRVASEHMGAGAGAGGVGGGLVERRLTHIIPCPWHAPRRCSRSALCRARCRSLRSCRTS